MKRRGGALDVKQGGVWLVAGLLAAWLAVGSARAATLSVYVPDATVEGQRHFEQVIGPAFEAAHPGTRVEFQFVTWTEYLERLTVAVLGGTAPDVIQVGGEFVGTLVLNGVIQPLDRYLVDWPHLHEYPQTALLDGQVEGQQYTVPYRLDVRTLIYRKDFFEEAGFDGDSPPETWDELLAYARKLVQVRPDGEMTRAGFHTIPAVHEALSFLFQGGGRLVDDTGTRVTFNSRAGVEAIQFYVDLARVHQVGLPGGGPFAAGGNPTVAGTAAMENAGDWVLGQMIDAFPGAHEDLGVALPARGAERRSVLNVNKWAITSQSRDPDLAWKFVAFVSGPDRLAEISRVNSFLPARAGLYREPPWSLDRRWFAYFQAAELAVPMPSHVYNLAEVFVHLRRALREGFEGERPVPAALEEAARLATVAVRGF